MLPSDYEAQTVDEISLKGNSGTVTNYLVLGVNPNDHLADTNILISINTKTRTIQIISLMWTCWCRSRTKAARGSNGSSTQPIPGDGSRDTRR